MKQLFWGLALLLGVGVAEGKGDEPAIREAVERVSPGASIEWVRETASDSVRAVKVAGSGGIWLVSADGQLVIARPGAVIDTATKDNLVSLWQAEGMRAAVEQVPEDMRIVFKAPNEKHRLTVFTDVDCGYCRVLHQQMAGYHDAGISIEYILYARAGVASETGGKHRAIMCSADRAAALDAAKRGQPVPAAGEGCGIDLAGVQNLAAQAGVSGTPSVSLQDGTVIGGYVPPPGAAKAIADWEQRRAESRSVAAAGR